MTAALRTTPAADGPLVVGIGGTNRPGSSSERLLRVALADAEAAGARTELFVGPALALPAYDPAQRAAPGSPARALIDAVAAADGVIIASPSYHGGMSGQLKNAIDYIEELRTDERPYLDGRAVGVIVCASGWQAPATTLVSIRSVVHALRGWPTPLGVVANSAALEFDDADAPLGPTREQLQMMAGQVVDFAGGRLFARATEAAVR